MTHTRRNSGQRLLPLDEPPCWSSLSEELRGQIVELWSQILVDHVNPGFAQQTENDAHARESHAEIPATARGGLHSTTQPNPGAARH